MGKKVLTEAQERKREKGICIEPFCKKKNAGGRHLDCHHHILQRFKAKNPIKYCFFYFRQNARRRGKEFKLTFRQFCRFVEKNNYMELKGKTTKSMTIDRKKNHLGYTKGNIQAVTLHWNSKKGDRMMYVPYFQQQMDSANRNYAN